MSKSAVTPVRKNPAPEVETSVAQPQVTAPQPLTDSESNILRMLVDKRKEFDDNIGTFIGHVMGARKVNPVEWAVSLADYKTIVRSQQPVQQAPAAPAPEVPPVPSA
jgi:hypothetical protein